VYDKKERQKNQEKTEKDAVKYESEWVENEMKIEGIVYSNMKHNQVLKTTRV
jgi:hypothetical protein